MNNLSDEIKHFLRRKGIDLVGIVLIEKIKSPLVNKDLIVKKFPNVKSIIVFGKRYLDSILNSKLTQALAIHSSFVKSFLEKIAYDLAIFLQDKGYLAFTIDPDGFPLDKLQEAIAPIYRYQKWFKDVENHIYKRENLFGEIPLVPIAQEAGLGWIGKSGMLITPQFGPRLRLNAILTNASLSPDEPFSQNLCGSCLVCIKTCVGNAINENGYDPVKCFKNEVENGESLIGIPYKICKALCLIDCPVGRLKGKYRFK
ncbi:MAG: hypothetical protein QW589_01945 [Candidatus Bathyarchaeia archaeon]